MSNRVVAPSSSANRSHTREAQERSAGDIPATRAVGDSEPRFAATETWTGVGNSVAVVFLISLAAAVLVRFNGLFPSVVNWDESLYAVMAQHWLLGELPYEAVWDQHSVGLPALFASILSAFPKSIVAIRLSACIAVAITATAVYFATRLIGRRSLPGVAAAILYILWTARWWGLAANTELYLNALIACAMVILLNELGRPARGRSSVIKLSFAMLLLGMALQVKHVALAETALIFATVCVGIAWSSRRLAYSAAVAGTLAFALPSLAVAAYFWSQGLGGTYFQAMVNANLTYVADRASVAAIWPLLPKSSLLPIGIAGVAAIFLWKRPEGRPVIVLLWAIAAVIDVALPGKFWDHYFLLLMPSGAVLAGYLAARFAAAGFVKARPRLAALTLPAALVLGHPAGVIGDALKARAFAQRDVPKIVAERIIPELAPDDAIFVFNYQPVLYLLTQAHLPTRYVQPDAWSREFSEVSGVVPVQELESVFQNQPKFVVFVAPDWLRMGNGVFAALENHLGEYDEEFEILDRQLLYQPVPVHVYRRKSNLALSGD